MGVCVWSVARRGSSRGKWVSTVKVFSMCLCVGYTYEVGCNSAPPMVAEYGVGFFFFFF